MTQLYLSAPSAGVGRGVFPVPLSPKLTRTLAALRCAGAAGLTTMELARESSSCGVAQDVWHLRRHGFNVVCTHEGTSKRGARVSRWRLVDA